MQIANADTIYVHLHLTATDEVHYFNPVSISQLRAAPLKAPYNLPIPLDSDSILIEAKLLDQPSH